MPTMEHDNPAVSSNESRLQNSTSQINQSFGLVSLKWWYRHFALPEPPASTSLSQRERIRHSKVASLAILVLNLFVLTILAHAIISKNLIQMIGPLVGLGVNVLALLLNRRGFVKSAGILALIMVYAGGTLTMLNYPDQLTIDNLLMLCFTIIPYMIVLAFFSANSLLPVFCISAIQTWTIVMYGPHDAAITHLLQTAPFQIFSQIYSLQLLTAITLYIWGRSTELALARADRAEEIAALEMYEKERQKQELEKKRRLDAGIQQILQTHVAVANGDLKARAPLNQDHELWQVANALNNLIARLQRASNTQRELKHQLKQQTEEVNKQATDHHPIYRQK